MTPDTFIYDGVKMEIRPTDGRYTCVHAFIEETDFTWFVQTGGDNIAIPIDEPYPACICGLKSTDVLIKPCIGRGCKHYDNAYLNDTGAVNVRF